MGHRERSVRRTAAEILTKLGPEALATSVVAASMTYGCSLRYMWFAGARHTAHDELTANYASAHHAAPITYGCSLRCPWLQALAIHAPAIMPQLAEEETDSRISAISLLARREMTWR